MVKKSCQYHHRQHQTDMISFCIFSDCFVKYVHIVLVQAWRENNSAK